MKTKTTIEFAHDELETLKVALSGYQSECVKIANITQGGSVSLALASQALMAEALLERLDAL